MITRLKAAGARLLRAAANVAAFLIALAAGCHGIGALLPERPIAEITAKLKHFRAHAQEYDTLFIGSSRIYHQIIPEIFDRAMAERGLPTRSFNAGIDAMRGPEMVYYCDQLLRARPRNLRWVFIEGGGMRIQINPVLGRTLRGVYWHDFARLCLVLRAGFANREPASLLWEHVQLFAENVSNRGRADLAPRWHDPQPRPPLDAHDPVGPRRDGFLPTAGETQQMPPAVRALYAQALAGVRAKPARTNYGDDESQRIYDRLLRRFEGAGASTVVLIPPSIIGRKFRLRPGGPPTRILLDHADPVAFPELFEERHRLDADHVNNAGAEIYTRLVAEGFGAELKRLGIGAER